MIENEQIKCPQMIKRKGRGCLSAKTHDFFGWASSFTLSPISCHIIKREKTKYEGFNRVWRMKWFTSWKRWNSGSRPFSWFRKYEQFFFSNLKVSYWSLFKDRVRKLEAFIRRSQKDVDYTPCAKPKCCHNLRSRWKISEQYIEFA